MTSFELKMPLIRPKKDCLVLESASERSFCWGSSTAGEISDAGFVSSTGSVVSTLSRSVGRVSAMSSTSLGVSILPVSARSRGISFGFDFLKTVK